MKKGIIILFLTFCALQSYAQAGDLFVGVQGGYATYYKAPLYGLNVSYDLSDPIQISLTGLLNPSITRKAEYSFDTDEKLKFYAAGLDVKLLLLNMGVWATGPTIGAEYMSVKYKDNSLKDFNTVGFVAGWHLRANITDNLRITAGWRYTNTKEEISASHHLFYVGFGYAFNLF
ncbi:hypothetical protein AGMMS50262_08160 [Bacteroidia bacterium]|nr:hypothetical protein AGMMS50262_08160 [Bacteroidia bacterium]